MRVIWIAAGAPAVGYGGEIYGYNRSELANISKMSDKSLRGNRSVGIPHLTYMCLPQLDPEVRFAARPLIMYSEKIWRASGDRLVLNRDKDMNLTSIVKGMAGARKIVKDSNSMRIKVKGPFSGALRAVAQIGWEFINSLAV